VKYVSLLVIEFFVVLLPFAGPLAKELFIVFLYDAASYISGSSFAATILDLLLSNTDWAFSSLGML